MYIQRLLLRLLVLLCRLTVYILMHENDNFIFLNVSSYFFLIFVLHLNKLCMNVSMKEENENVFSLILLKLFIDLFAFE